MTANLTTPVRRRTGVGSAAAATWHRADRPPARQAPECSSFITRCVRIWFTAGGSAGAFLARWTPLGAYAPNPPRPERARRSPIVEHRTERRPAYRRVDAAGADRPEVLRRRYPMVNALLIELSAMQRRGVAVLRTQRHR